LHHWLHCIIGCIASLAELHHWPHLHHCIDAPAPTRRAQLSLSPWGASPRRALPFDPRRHQPLDALHRGQCARHRGQCAGRARTIPHRDGAPANRQPPAKGPTSRLRDYLCCRAGVAWLLREAAHPLS
jgi:hypothetical protein